MSKKSQDMMAFKRILKMQSDNKKTFFNKLGCGLEIEFGVVYDPFCSRYIKTGLEKLRAIVGNNGKFVPDITISKDFNVEVVLKPMIKEDLKVMVFKIKQVIDYYENFILDDNCGVHANFLADPTQKQMFYDVLVGGGYENGSFSHNKYKIDFLDIVNSNNLRNYEEYYAYQISVSGKYTAVNFLKDNLIEFRALDLNWENIEYVNDLYEMVLEASTSTATVSELVPHNPAMAMQKLY
jgi:hypothetical protein